MKFSQLFLVYIFHVDLKVRFRVEQIKYPPIPIEQESNVKPFAPMEIHVCYMLFFNPI